ncbi:hypothetical protein AGMMS50212_01860 [Spirochaetia bacterium]|nr:hypothetical protein AGMMS50212_01860 [Spirochaetia bacterium]
MIPSGYILLNKNPGVTSFEALYPIKRALGTGKVGHTGTLDKFASGLLIILSGKALKLTNMFMKCDKSYTGMVRLGAETSTLDPEGEVIAQAPLPSLEAFEAALPQWTGEIMQTPPAYSALRINGKRASELARKGAAPEMKARPVTIHSIKILSWEPPDVKIEVHCSSGTYIRSLARDLALSSGSRGHLVALTRITVGGFSLDDAISIDREQNTPPQFSLLPIDNDVLEKIGTAATRK